MKRIESWDQVEIKSSMGLYKGLASFRTRFHFSFWKPMTATNGTRIYFGRYAEFETDELIHNQIESRK